MELYGDLISPLWSLLGICECARPRSGFRKVAAACRNQESDRPVTEPRDPLSWESRGNATVVRTSRRNVLGATLRYPYPSTSGSWRHELNQIFEFSFATGFPIAAVHTGCGSPYSRSFSHTTRRASGIVRQAVESTMSAPRWCFRRWDGA